MGSMVYRPLMWLIGVWKSFEFLILKYVAPGWTEKFIKRIFAEAGVTINGINSWDVCVHNKEFYARVASGFTMGLGESYMEGLWDCDDLPEFSRRIAKHRLYRHYLNPWNKFLESLKYKYFNLQTQKKAWEVGKHHYDIGNELLESYLDPYMIYSCGYWKTATTLAQAQIDKMDLIARKLLLKPGMKVLDIGCGWGGLCKYLAEHYGVTCVGVTVSQEGVNYGRKFCKGLPVEFRLQDYRSISADEKFDRIVSVGMFEHVGHKNYDTFFDVAHRALVDDGVFLLHTVGIGHHDFPRFESWYHTYIFPNGIVPYYRQVMDSIEKRFIVEDWQNFGNDYSTTIKAWSENFTENWPTIKEKYGEPFFRMWIYYLKMAEGIMRSRKSQLWQIVLSKDGIEGGYYGGR